MASKGNATGATTNTKRFRLQVSDGLTIGSVMVASQVAEDIEQRSQLYVKGAILRVSEIISNDVNGRR